MSQGKVSKGEFAFKLSDTGSELFLGGVNPALYKEPIYWTPVFQQGYWPATGSIFLKTRAASTEIARQFLIIDSKKNLHSLACCRLKLTER
jgi:hypothetical protein